MHFLQRGNCSWHRFTVDICSAGHTPRHSISSTSSPSLHELHLVYFFTWSFRNSMICCVHHVLTPPIPHSPLHYHLLNDSGVQCAFDPTRVWADPTNRAVLCRPETRAIVGHTRREATWACSIARGCKSPSQMLYLPSKSAK